MLKIFKWDGNWKTVTDNIRKKDVKRYFARPVTSVNNLGVWDDDLYGFRNCNIGDYVFTKGGAMLNKVKRTINLQHGDCLELMENIPDKSVNLILADLPYRKTIAKWDQNIPATSVAG